MHVSVVFVFLFYFIISCLYSAVSLTLVKEERFIIITNIQYLGEQTGNGLGTDNVLMFTLRVY